MQKPSSILILNLDTIKNEPVCPEKPVTLKGLKTFLIDQGLSLPKQITELIEDTDIFCKAFYYSKNGPLLMIFELGVKAKEGQEEKRQVQDDIGVACSTA